MNQADSDILLDRDLDKPRVVGLVIVKYKDALNACPVTWQALSSTYEKPTVVSIGLSNTNFTFELLKESKEFVYAYPHKKYLKDVLYLGTHSGRDINKIKNTQFRFVSSTMISTPSLEDAVLNFECRVIQMIRLETFTIVIGEVAHIEASKSYTGLDKIFSFGNHQYGSIDNISILGSSI